MIDFCATEAYDPVRSSKQKKHKKWHTLVFLICNSLIFNNAGVMEWQTYRT